MPRATATTAPVQHYRSVEYRIWYRSPHGGSMLEIARDEATYRGIRDRLGRQSIAYRVSRYYFIL
jgi:hypothetical protein